MDDLKDLYEQAKKAYKEKNLVRTASLLSRAATIVAGDSDQKHDQAFESIYRKIRND
jgi:hypothetical protein